MIPPISREFRRGGGNLMGGSKKSGLIDILRFRRSWSPVTRRMTLGTCLSLFLFGGYNFALSSSIWSFGRFTARTNDELVDYLKETGVIRSKEVETAMRKVDRKDYVLHKDEAYQDLPSSIGNSQTISAPHMHGHALELLNSFLRPGAKVLDVGSGSGYLSACLAHMVKPGGLVVGLELVENLVNFSKDNVKKANMDLLEEGVLQLKLASGWHGDPDNAPFDAIHVGAAAHSVPPALIEQLKRGGRMVIPVGPQFQAQKLFIIDKKEDGTITETPILGVVYVPLIETETVNKSQKKNKDDL